MYAKQKDNNHQRFMMMCKTTPPLAGMRFNISTAFSMYEQVKIKEIDIPATVTEIALRGTNLLYGVEYWWEGACKFVLVREQELDKMAM